MNPQSPAALDAAAQALIEARRDHRQIVLPGFTPASHEEALGLIEGRRLMGRGLGWVDVHLLASALLQDLGLWTLDRRLDAAAAAVGARFVPPTG